MLIPSCPTPRDADRASNGRDVGSVADDTPAGSTRSDGAGQVQAAGEARYLALADALPQMVWIISAKNDLVATYMNPQFRAFYGEIGALREERIGRNHPDDAPRMAKLWAKALAEQQAYAVDGRFRRHDGVYRWHKMITSPVHRDGEVVEWILTALDIDDIVTARNQLAETTDLLRLAQESAGAGVWDFDIRTGAVRHSRQSARMHQIEAAAAADVDATFVMTSAEWESHVVPSDVPIVWAQIRRAIAEHEIYTCDFRTIDAHGIPRRCLHAFGRVIVDDVTGEPTRLVGLQFDVTEQRRAEQALRLSEARLRASEERLGLALDSSDEGLWDWDLDAGRVWVSARWHTMLGDESGEAEVNPRQWRRRIHPADASRVARTLRDHLTGSTASFECEHRVRRPDGRVIWVLVRGKVVSRKEDGRPKRIIGTQFETTQRKEAEARIEHMALHDALTDLPNRALFHNRLDAEFTRARKLAGRFAIFCLDLDRFKEINDTLGHPAGDMLLRATAERLRRVFREGDTVARLGGDEFVIILTDPGSDEEIGALAQRVIDAISQPVDLVCGPAHIGVSVGIAIGPADGADTDTLFKNADIALYRAKAAGRNTFRYYETGMDAVVAARNQLELDLREAVRRNQLVLHYQPFLAVERNVIAGFEALMRWVHPRLGLLAPAEFIPLAEDSGLIVQIGGWALAQACARAASWPGDLRVAVNVSAVQVLRPGLEDSVRQALASSGLSPDRLELEVTETVLMQDSHDVLATLHRLRAMGIRIALDDFGTGYSSLSYLRQFPFDRIKIDKSFVAGIDEPHTAAIVGTIIQLGQRLGTTITAEGVETERQLDALRQGGCHEVQGFLFSRPLSAEHAESYIGDNAPRAAA